MYCSTSAPNWPLHYTMINNDSAQCSHSAGYMKPHATRMHIKPATYLACISAFIGKAVYASAVHAAVSKVALKCIAVCKPIHCQALPHPLHMLPPVAIPIRQLLHKGRSFCCSCCRDCFISFCLSSGSPAAHPPKPMFLGA